MKTLYVVAMSQEEAEELADRIGYRTMAMAREHLREVKAPPTDSYYAEKYDIYIVERPKAAQ